MYTNALRSRLSPIRQARATSFVIRRERPFRNDHSTADRSAETLVRSVWTFHENKELLRPMADT